ncbi:MAG TPA: multiheme c-type cytochrome [Blastocatellia bacterium]|jgi:mono/diheme cytochrome c family protein|nr:multiheme c-type cytochrome [Blastocatellia bacterium]
MKAEGGARGANVPMLKRIVSANIVADSADAMTPPPFLIREISTGSGSKPVKVAFVGSTFPTAQPPLGFRITAPVEAVGRIVPEAKRKADLVIVLAHGKLDEIIRLAREVPGIDVILAGTGDMFNPPLRIGETLVAFSAYETRFLGELRIYRDAGGLFTTRTRLISLDSVVGDDEAGVKVATEVTEAQLKAFKANQALLGEWLTLVRPRSNGSAGEYASSNACSQCHSAQYLKWANTRHSRASDQMSLKAAEFDSSCLACHGSGLQKSGVLASGELPKLANVQCEQCHGPGAQHVAKPAKGYGRVGAAGMKALCASCHTPQASPNFDLMTGWQKIKH